MSTDAVVHGTSSEEVTRIAAAYPVPSLSFAEMHRALGDLHVVRKLLREYGVHPVPEGRVSL